MKIYFSIIIAIGLLSSQNICNASSTPMNLTVINGLRDFKPLFLGEKRDYFLSNKVANAEDADKVCKSIGERYHLITLENDDEYRQLLPYLRSLEIPRVWTSGIKYTSGSKSNLEWTRPLPSFPMNFINFPSSSKLAKLLRLPENRTYYDSEMVPRCKNGFLTPRCKPSTCNVILDPCEVETPNCDITSCKPCTVTRPECSATCNNCTVENPVCTVIQEPCKTKTKKCTVDRLPCEIITPPCETVRPPCLTVYPPCEVSTPKPCPTTTKPRCPPTTTEKVCTIIQPPCSDEKCPPPVTTCEPVDNKCDSKPEICFPGAIICPPPVTTCPPEQTVCQPPILHCPKPSVNCPDPEVDCPPPKTQCTPPKVTCDSPEINCPGIVVNCPAPSYSCPGPIVNCPPAKIECDKVQPCVYPEPAEPCSVSDTEAYEMSTPPISLPVTQCDDCLPNGCVALRKETDFKWKLEDCSKEFHFICEGTA